MQRAEAKAFPDATEKPRMAAHALDVPQVAESFTTDARNGLTLAEASRRLAAEGPNALKGEKPVTFWAVFGRQFASFLIAILLVASVISFALGEVADAVLIFAIVGLNAVLGTFQELRAERTLEALMLAVAPMARVIRGGVMREVPAAELVRGDVAILHAGDLVPGDIRLME